MKILGPEKLQNLELPEVPEQNLSLQKVVYKSSLLHLGDDDSSRTEISRFNSFTGYQTLNEREESFKVLFWPYFVLENYANCVLVALKLHQNWCYMTCNRITAILFITYHSHVMLYTDFYR